MTGAAPIREMAVESLRLFPPLYFPASRSAYWLRPSFCTPHCATYRTGMKKDCKLATVLMDQSHQTGIRELEETKVNCVTKKLAHHKVYKWDEDENEKLLLFAPAWLGHLLAFVFHLVHLFTKLNSQLEWSLSLTGSTAIQQELLMPEVWNTQQKLGRQMLNDGPTLANDQPSAWRVTAFRKGVSNPYLPEDVKPTIYKYIMTIGSIWNKLGITETLSSINPDN